MFPISPAMGKGMLIGRFLIFDDVNEGSKGIRHDLYVICNNVEDSLADPAIRLVHFCKTEGDCVQYVRHKASNRVHESVARPTVMSELTSLVPSNVSKSSSS
jgi:hypothetical protein